ncbi:transmembrane and coiled-coil domain-containing protein [Verticillium alfalfae VaMs.102]|uniref:Transmembrane and coiled-coil domain-containing protein n=1 Tax=Verticillium alfalfae (strain VaMs.102 / ATCC MYA-4576 / FGSC 10136) TaxID=526221 RepID=C9SEW8_VERA1|nr:transmembrane and coiled-coil domain-containing protein [Verticillium alfalfae VaMs.102]EEY17754.1 transmembrane and coiled-coil domain-containing protein [Verticillium alfalfae VaMs.102]
MAPLAADPRQILVVLDDTRRREFYTLIEDIMRLMRSEIDPTGNDRHDGGWPSVAQWEQQQKQRKLAGRHASELSSIRQDALEHFGDWRQGILKKLKEITSAKEDKKVLEARKNRQDEVAKMKAASSGDEEDLITLGDTENSSTTNAKDVATFQKHYQPVPTSLTALPVEDRRELLSSMLLVVLSTGNYAAHSRVLVLHLASSFGLPLAVLITEETEIAKYLVEASTAKGEDGTTSKSAAAASAMSGEAEATKRRQNNQSSRFWKVGLASVAGAAVIGVTGGLAAPAVAGVIGGIMGSVGLGGVASFLGIFWANGALVGALFGAYGAKMTGEMMDQYAKEVEDFRFLPLKEEYGQDAKEATSDEKKTRRLRVTIGINGWLENEVAVTKPMEGPGATSRRTWSRATPWKYVKLEILKNTVLVSLSAVLWPAYLLGTASNIDNPYNLARNRSEKAGRVLADALINRAQGERPVTLIGYSLGARAIHSCLKTLAQRRAFGLVDSVVLIGAPTPSDTEQWQVLRTVVAGRIFNVYSENDYILGFMYRATSLQLGVAGLQPIEGVDGLENLDLSKDVAGHLRYPDLIAQVLTKCGFPDVKDGEGEIERDKDIERAKQAQPDDMPEEARAIQGEKPKTGGGDGGEQDAKEDEPSPPLPPRRKTETGAGGTTSPPPWASDRKEDPLHLGTAGMKHVEPLAEQDLPERRKP